MMWFLYWVFLIGCAVVLLLKWRSKVITDRKSHPFAEPPKIKRRVIARPAAAPTVTVTAISNVESKWPDIEPPKTEEEAKHREFDWSAARAALQNIAYGMVGKDVPQKDKDEFKAFVARFAKHDPLYLETMKIVRPLLLKNPGMIQSELYKGCNESTKEAMRYVLYFSEALGEVQRIKKGRSYQLYLLRDI